MQNGHFALQCDTFLSIFVTHREFLNLHPKISFVGLLLTPAANIQDADEPWYGDSVTVGISLSYV